MSEAEVLRMQVRKLQTSIDEIESAERIAKADRFVGRHFRYRNCYSCPQSDAERWWLYVKVVGRDKHGYLKTEQFQIDMNGMASMEHRGSRISIDSSYVPIAPSEWKRQRNRFLAYVAKNLSK